MVRWRLQDYFPIFPKFVKQGGNQFIVPASIVQIEKVDDKGPTQSSEAILTLLEAIVVCAPV